MSYWNIFLGFALLSILPFGASAQDVPPKEIQETWVGKSLVGKTGAGKSFTMILKADGAITISGDAANDVGTWRLSESGYCTTWKTIRAGQERCFTVRRVEGGEVVVYNPDGSVSGRFAQVQ